MTLVVPGRDEVDEVAFVVVVDEPLVTAVVDVCVVVVVVVVVAVVEEVEVEVTETVVEVEVAEAVDAMVEDWGELLSVVVACSDVVVVEVPVCADPPAWVLPLPVVAGVEGRSISNENVAPSRARVIPAISATVPSRPTRPADLLAGISSPFLRRATLIFFRSDYRELRVGRVQDLSLMDPEPVFQDRRIALPEVDVPEEVS